MPRARADEQKERSTKKEERKKNLGGCWLLGLVRWVVPSKYKKNLGIGFLIFKLATMARRERGSREASALGVIG